MNQDCSSFQARQSAPENSVSSTFAVLSRKSLKTMMGCVQALYHLSQNPLYQEQVTETCPGIALFDPGHDAVMMGYDFHLGRQGPQLIEVNTNAGGGLLPWLRPDFDPVPEKTKRALLDTFFTEFFRFSGQKETPKTLVILDEKPEEQFLYPEMVCFANLFRKAGIKACILDPGELDASKEGVYHDQGRVDLIYNRHTDFYLETSRMAGLRAAYMAGRICLTPNPRAYTLLADKRRLALWSDEKNLRQFNVSRRETGILLNTIPESHLLSDFDTEELWEQRKNWVLKPLTKFGSRGVILGQKMTRKRFNSFTPEETLVQKFIPPSLTHTKAEDDMKTDFRLFAYRDRVLGILARLFHGQVTNMQTPGGGFARVKIESS